MLGLNINLNKQKGFTLIELLVVIGILAILLAITLIAINPARQFAQANNTKRSSDVNAILNAIGQFQADNNGTLPTGMPAPGAAAVNISAAGADICGDLTPDYIAQLPTDPTSAAAGDPVLDTCPAGWDTGYQVSVGGGTNNRVTITAPNAELTQTITVTR